MAEIESKNLRASEPLLWSDSEVFRGKNRWAAGFSISICHFGIYYVLDNPAVLEEELKEEYGFSNFQYSQFYAVAGLATLILTPFVGAFNKYVTLRSLFSLFFALVCAGQGLFALGAYRYSYDMMLLGRAFIGVGVSTCLCLASAILFRWFRSGYDMALSNAIKLSFGRLGTVSNNFINVFLLKQNCSLPTILTVSFLFIVALGLLGGIFFFHKDKSLDELYVKDGALEHVDDPKNAKEQKVKLKDLKKLNSLWFSLSMAVMTVYSCFMSFGMLGNAYMQEAFGYGKWWASTLVSLPAMFTFVIGPFYGAFLDRFGRKPQILILSSVLFFVGHLLLLLSLLGKTSDVIVFLALLLFAIAYLLFSNCVWICVPLAVPEHLSATALGLAFTCEELGLTLSTEIVGKLGDTSGGYTLIESYFVVLTFLGVISCLFVQKFDKQSQGVLAKPTLRLDITKTD